MDSDNEPTEATSSEAASPTETPPMDKIKTVTSAMDPSQQMAIATSDALPSGPLADTRLLDKIDKLFECNVGHMIDIPQIVVVGDQSSGKSSVLHGLKGLPFPRDSGLCTRFATQLIFRRAAKPEISISVIPSPTATQQHKDSVQAWKMKRIESLDAAVFVEIMQQVYQLMGIGESGVTFSADVLRLELCGPDLDHLSIVDVPGIFHAVTEGVTTDADKALVRKMVMGYMQNPRSVILMVVPANVDVATQDILQMAKEVDPRSKRTLGILTKPDLVDDGAEQHVLDLMNGVRHKLGLGWHMVRNLGQRQMTDGGDDRHDIEERFFKDNSLPWTTLGKDQVGIKSLQVRLRKILYSHVKANFQDVRLQVHQTLKARRDMLESLGRSRATSLEQSNYLMQVASDFQRVLIQAESTKYSSNDIFDEHPALSLFTILVHLAEAFNQAVLTKGHSHEWDCTNAEEDQIIDNDDRTAAKSRTIRDTPDLIDILTPAHVIDSPTQDDIYYWLQKVYNKTRGYSSIGTFQSSVIPNTMKQQTIKWAPLATGFVSDCIASVHDFITTLLSVVCTDEQVQDELLTMLMGELRESYGRATEHTQLLLDIERNQPPVTQNHYYAANLVNYRNHRDPPDVDFNGAPQIEPKFDLSNTDQAVIDIHDYLHAYYKCAVKRFIDNVCQQSVGNCLLYGKKTPLKLFTEQWVHGLSDEQLAAIAGEDESTRRRRAELKKEVAELDLATQILK